MKLRLLGGVLAATLTAAPATFAQAPAAPLPAEQPAAAPAAPAGPAKLSLSTLRVVRGSVLAGDRWVVRGTLSPYVPGQQVVVRAYRGAKKLSARRLTVKRAGGAGRFRLTMRLSGAGRVTIRASHRASAELLTAVAGPLRVQVVARSAAAGSRGIAVRRLQTRLAARGYVIGTRGLYDDRTARAVMAFRKLAGMTRAYNADEEVFRRLARGQGAFRVRYPGHGRHIEADITHQVMALIDGRKVSRIYPISSGAPVTPTILGSFRVYLKSPGTNAKGMVHSSYFIRGYAIHGFASVPAYPASHGCLRVPVPDAASIFAWVRPGTTVDTYYR